MNEALANLHLLRPQWLWALLALPLLVWWWRLHARRALVWRDVVDPHLLPHLLESRRGVRGRIMPALALSGFVLAVLALSGPSWRQVEQPLWQARAPLVIALDLSSATTATDLQPSRLLQARAKLDALLRQRQGGQVGLVAYAGAAFTVAPLTDDAGNVALFLDALAPSIMPVDGQRSDLAIEWSAKLLRQAGFDQGRILLLTDHADAAARAAATVAAGNGYRVSVLGLGSATGAAYRRRNGEIAHAHLDTASLRALANAGGGKLALLSADNSDLQSLGVLDPQVVGETRAQDGRGRGWQDQGYWLLLPLLLLGLFAFRRGGAVLAVLLCLCWPLRPAQADGLDGLWQRRDQQQYQQMLQGRQAFRAGKFDQAAQAWKGLADADAQYNRGNALAKAGQYKTAIAAYEAALQAQPGMADALANKAAVEALLKRQQAGKGQQKQQNKQSQQDGAQKNDTAKSSDGERKGTSDDSSKGQPSQDKQSQDKSQPSPEDRNGNASAPQDDKHDVSPEPADASKQQAADDAQRERMQRALQQARQEQGKENPEAERAMQADPDETPEQRERRLSNQAWLRRVPDDPGGLLRRKFALEYQRRQQQGAP